MHTASDIEIFACVLHECRHCYQQACIDFPDIFNNEPKEIVNEWKKDFEQFIDPNLEEKTYLNLYSEIDANEFSYTIIKDLFTS